MDITRICAMQRAYFEKGETKNVGFRIAQLKKLQVAIRAQEKLLLDALQADLDKSGFEGYMSEVGMVLEELAYMLRHVRRFARAKAVPTPLAQGIAASRVLAKPYGNVLIMSPWNYPLLLTIGPLVDALAAGNTALVKPSAYSPNVSHAIAKLLGDTFAPEYVAVIEGGRNENTALLEEKFDYIFFTGSKTVGRLVMEKAARHLTPVTLELGGKSPCIVDETANIAWAARRIVFGKYLNCGQTCVAPDYVLVHARVHDALIAAMKREIVRQFGEKPLDNPNYGKIVNQKHFDRLCGLLADYGLPARYAQRKNAYVAYLKEGEMVAGFLTLTGAMNSTLAFEEARVMRQVAGSVNRIHNFEDANMNKAATAAAAQLVDIEGIQRAKGLQSLPPRLREAAELRLNNPEATLSELAQMAEVSKSGLNHRFAKLAALAEEYRGSGLGYTQEEE